MKKIFYISLLLCFCMPLMSCTTNLYTEQQDYVEYRGEYITYNYVYYYNGHYCPVIYSNSIYWFYHRDTWYRVPRQHYPIIRRYDRPVRKHFNYHPSNPHRTGGHRPPTHHKPNDRPSVHNKHDHKPNVRPSTPHNDHKPNVRPSTHNGHKVNNTSSANRRSFGNSSVSPRTSYNRNHTRPSNTNNRR
jgi:hypothetical protein